MIETSFLKILKSNIPQNIRQPRRSQIYVGYQCHQHCGFCYYKHHYNEPMFDKSYVLAQIDVELAYGITDFEITGGEPSECSDLVFYCQYIKQKLPTAKIAVIINGSLWTVKDIWKYIDEVLISYHISRNAGKTEMLPFGNTYFKVAKTIEYAKQHNKIIRTNTVIGTFNLNDIDAVTDDLLDFSPHIINFLPINLFDDASDMSQFIDYRQLRPVLKQNIDKSKNADPNILVCVRFMPFCNMEGYEQHILGTWQHIYDWFDWNPELCGSYLIEYLNKFNTTEEILRYLGKYGSRSFERSYECIKFHYEKSKKCLNCKYYLICDGVEKTKNSRLLDSIQNTPGKMIKNIMHYIGTSIQDKYDALH